MHATALTAAPHQRLLGPRGELVALIFIAVMALGLARPPSVLSAPTEVVALAHSEVGG